MSFQFIPDPQAGPSTKVSRAKTSMSWTEQHDSRLCGEISLIDPFTGTKKGTVQRGKKWDEVAINLSKLEDPLFKVDKRAVRDRYNLLSQRYRKKMKEEEKASGVSPEMTEVEMALESIIEAEDAAEEENQNQTAIKRDKADEEKNNAEQIRRKAMEKLGETQKRKATDDDDVEKKKKRRSTGNDSINYIREKNEQLAKYKEEELSLRKKELELETKKHDAMMQVILQQQQQQQKQFNDFQGMMMTMLTKFTQK